MPRPAGAGLRWLVLLAAASGGAQALQPGEYAVRLQDAHGQTLDIATLSLEAAGDRGLRYRIRWDAARFEDHFLSMRPFKCLPHPAQLICHLPYPYAIRRVISETDLTDLEYDLLFLHKTPLEYGINAWNGLYFELAPTADGLAGELRETDLNVLQAPPRDGDLRPIDRQELDQAADRHWPRRLLIEPVPDRGDGR